MSKQIKKCKICGGPYWDDNRIEKKEGTDYTCPDCIKEADKNEMNSP